MHQSAAMERREHYRYLIALEIEVREAGSNFSSRGTTTDISLGGCYIATIFPLAVGSGISFTLWMGEQPIKGHGTVQTCHPGVGMGVKFTDLSEEIKSVLDDYLHTAASLPVGSALGARLISYR